MVRRGTSIQPHVLTEHFETSIISEVDDQGTFPVHSIIYKEVPLPFHVLINVRVLPRLIRITFLQGCRETTDT